MLEQQPFEMRRQLPEEFTQADALRLQQYNSALSEASKQVDDGELDPKDGEVLRQSILHFREPLQIKQAAQMQLTKDKQVNALREDSAQAQGMEQADMKYRASQLPNRIVPIQDPRTGQTAMMYESEPNKWAQIEFPPPESAGGEQGGVQDYFPLGGGLVMNQDQMTPPNPDIGPNDPGAGPAPTQVIHGESPGGPAPQKNMPMTGQDQHQLDIWNGASQNRVMFDANGNIVSQSNPGPGQMPQLSPRQAAELIGPDRANQIAVEVANQMEKFRPRREQYGPPGPEGDRRYGMDTAQWQRDTSMSIQRKIGGIARMEQQKEMAGMRQQATEARDQQKEAAEKSAADLKAKDEKRKELRKEKDNYRDRLLSEVKEMKKEDDESGTVRSRQERLQAAKDYLAEVGFTEPVDPDAPPEEAKAKPKSLDDKAAEAGGVGTKQPGAQVEITPEALAVPSKVYNSANVGKLAKAVDDWQVKGGTTILGIQIPNSQTSKMNNKIGEVRRFLKGIENRGTGMTVGERAYYENLLKNLGDEKVAKALSAVQEAK